MGHCRRVRISKVDYAPSFPDVGKCHDSKHAKKPSDIDVKQINPLMKRSKQQCQTISRNIKRSSNRRAHVYTQEKIVAPEKNSVSNEENYKNFESYKASSSTSHKTKRSPVKKSKKNVFSEDSEEECNSKKENQASNRTSSEKREECSASYEISQMSHPWSRENNPASNKKVQVANLSSSEDSEEDSPRRYKRIEKLQVKSKKTSNIHPCSKKKKTVESAITRRSLRLFEKTMETDNAQLMHSKSISLIDEDSLKHVRDPSSEDSCSPVLDSPTTEIDDSIGPDANEDEERVSHLSSTLCSTIEVSQDIQMKNVENEDSLGDTRIRDTSQDDDDDIFFLECIKKNPVQANRQDSNDSDDEITIVRIIEKPQKFTYKDFFSHACDTCLSVTASFCMKCHLPVCHFNFCWEKHVSRH